jgi:SAM-dependent methyltransferase
MSTMRVQDWAVLVASGGVILTIAAALLAHALPAFFFALIAICAAGVARVASQRHPGPMSPALRVVLHLPRGPHSSRSLLQLLAPRSGERILEIGSGIGAHAVPVALALIPGGTLDAVDIQQVMLDELSHRVRAAGLTNVSTVLADAEHLPYSDNTFDGAFLITVLGEIPNPDSALRELFRVLKPAGRLVVGEMTVDPDFVSLGALTAQARNAGFTVDGRRGPDFAYLARFCLACAPEPAAQHGMQPTALVTERAAADA